MSTMRETASTSSPGTSRFTGIVISFITAIAVFAAGQAIVTRLRGSSNVVGEVAPAEPAPAPRPLPLAPAPAPQAVAVPAPPAAAPVEDPNALPPGTEGPLPLPQGTAPAEAAPTTASAPSVPSAPAPSPPPSAARPTTAPSAPTQVAPAPKVTPPASPTAAAPVVAPAVPAVAPAAKAPVVAVVAAPKAAATAPSGSETRAAVRAEAEAPPAAQETAPAGDRQKPAPALAVALPGPAGSDKPTDKDIAREAWRRNLPDISGDETRASVLIPIKGSIEGATYHINTKPKSVIVNLPKAESLVTMHFYKIKREGFGNLWVSHEGDGTTLKLMLGDAIAPQVEIHDDYIRINVRKPSESAPGTTATAPTE